MKINLGKITTIAISLLTINPSANASSWNYIWAGNEDTVYFFDADSIERGNNTLTLWLKTVQTKKAESDGSWSTAMRWKINCTQRTILPLAYSIYDANGKFIRSINKPGEETSVIPDSTGEAVLKVVCEPNFPRDTSGKKYFKIPGNDIFQATRIYSDALNSQIDTAPK